MEEAGIEIRDGEGLGKRGQTESPTRLFDARRDLMGSTLAFREPTIDLFSSVRTASCTETQKSYDFPDEFSDDEEEMGIHIYGRLAERRHHHCAPVR